MMAAGAPGIGVNSGAGGGGGDTNRYVAQNDQRVVGLYTSGG